MLPGLLHLHLWHGRMAIPSRHPTGGGAQDYSDNAAGRNETSIM